MWLWGTDPCMEWGGGWGGVVHGGGNWGSSWVGLSEAPQWRNGSTNTGILEGIFPVESRNRKFGWERPQPLPLPFLLVFLGLLIFLRMPSTVDLGGPWCQLSFANRATKYYPNPF
jgi:hypothetical protein